MEITVDYANPLKEAAVQELVQKFEFSKEPPLDLFNGDIYAKRRKPGIVWVMVTTKLNRIIIRQVTGNPGLQAFFMLDVAQAAAFLGEGLKVTFTQELTHLDLLEWFPGGIRDNNSITFPGY